MLKHAEIWRAIDRLAAAKGMSPSALARRSGLDPTTFNKSKRVTKDGKQRWPSTESVAKILTATETPLPEFVRLVDEDENAGHDQRIPLIAQSAAQREGIFDDDGAPASDGWDVMRFPGAKDSKIYALEVEGDELEPVYRDGDILVVSPSANIRRGDRVIVGTRDGTMVIRQFLRQGMRRVDLRPVSTVGEETSLDADSVTWIARIIWASQ